MKEPRQHIRLLSNDVIAGYSRHAWYSKSVLGHVQRRIFDSGPRLQKRKVIGCIHCDRINLSLQEGRNARAPIHLNERDAVAIHVVYRAERPKVGCSRLSNSCCQLLPLDILRCDSMGFSGLEIIIIGARR